MRTITTEAFEVYELGELEPEARLAAIWNVRHQLTGAWWGETDNESIAEEILFGIAVQLASPGWNQYGPGDFPGIDGVELVGWDVERDMAAQLTGRLTRENAPALPWVDSISHVLLQPMPRGGHTSMEFYGYDSEDETSVDVVGELRDAILTAIEIGLGDGRSQLEYLTSEARAEDDILANGREFYADGRLYVA